MRRFNVVATTKARNTFIGNGVTTAFPTDFVFFEGASLVVTLVTNATGAEVVKVLTTDYTVSGGAGATGTVTATSFTPAVGQTLVIERVEPPTQGTDYTSFDTFNAETTENRLDRIVMAVQRALDLTIRAVKLPITDSPTTPANLTLPVPEAGKFVVGKDASSWENKTAAALGTIGVPVAIVDGGTGATTAAAARTALGLGTAAVENVAAGGTSGLLRADGSGASLTSISRSAFNVLDHGLVGDNATNNTAAFNALLVLVKNSNAVGIKRIYFPKGVYRFNSKPSDIDFGVEIFGDGMAQTDLIRNYNGSGVIGMFKLIGGSNGTKIRSLAIRAASGTTAGSAIQVLSDAANAVSFLAFEDLYLSTLGSDTWTNTIHFDGSAKTTAPTGCRDISLTNCHIFGANGFSAIFKSVVGLSVKGGGFYPAGGTNAGSGGISIEGIAAVQSQYVNINVVTVDDIQLLECDDVRIASPSIGGNITNVNTVDRCHIEGYVSGTVQHNWVNGSVIQPRTTRAVNGYTYLPGGYILQWGKTLVNTGGTTTINLPLAYSTAQLNVTATAEAAASYQIAIASAPFSTTQFGVVNTAGTNINVYWQSLGY